MFSYSHEYLSKMRSIIAKTIIFFIPMNTIHIFVLGDREMSMWLDRTEIRPGLAEPGFYKKVPHPASGIQIPIKSISK